MSEEVRPYKIARVWFRRWQIGPDDRVHVVASIGADDFSARCGLTQRASDVAVLDVVKSEDDARLATARACPSCVAAQQELLAGARP